MTTQAEIIREIETIDENELRSSFWELEGDGDVPPPPYSHQALGLDRIERGGAFTPPLSGILHYPTGAGKTRVGMEFIARSLRQNPKHRFVWATHTRTLIRQTMVRMAELSPLFPKGTCFTWADAEEARDHERDFHVVFMTRNALTEAFHLAGDGRSNHAWSRHLQSRNPLTLIYDECHQLGAEKLQQKMRKFYDSGIPHRSKMWRVIGLSATPVPTRIEAHGLLQEHVFPLRGEAPSTSHGWPFHVIQKVSNDALVNQRVLCRINPYIDEQALFDIPADLFRAVIGEACLKPLGANANDTDIQKYALQFNSKVMAAPAVIAFLAKRLGENLPLPGKTIVFVPNIDAANRLAGVLYETFAALRGKVAAVHSKMEQDEYRVPGQEKASIHQVLARFRRLGEEPSILINVDMLTEGFDDPKVHAVVLARLTLSTNRFWQMIGRGTRGKAAKGTSECIVIDPVKLTRLYNYFADYQPTFGRDDEVEFEDLDDKAGKDLISPVVPQVSRPPDPSTGVYTVDPELERVHAQVALALRHFLQGEPVSEAQALDVARQSQLKIAAGKVVLQPSAGSFDPTTAAVMLLGEIAGLERRAAVDLEWFRQQQIPAVLTESLLKQRMRALRAIESMHLWTESSFADAQMSGEFLAALQREATGTPAVAPLVASASTGVQGIDGRPFDSAEEVVLDAALAIAGADRHVDDTEVAAIAETLRRMCGRAPTPAVEAAIRERAVPGTIPYERLDALLSPPQRQLLLMQLTEVVAADGVVTPEEREMLYAFATRLAVPEAFVESLLGANLARADVMKRAAQPVAMLRCQSCGSETPGAGAFCTSCGTRLSR